jgi:hypothetical protein
MHLFQIYIYNPIPARKGFLIRSWSEFKVIIFNDLHNLIFLKKHVNINFDHLYILLDALPLNYDYEMNIVLLF